MHEREQLQAMAEILADARRSPSPTLETNGDNGGGGEQGRDVDGEEEGGGGARKESVNGFDGTVL
jgi:hypothetical protein